MDPVHHLIGTAAGWGGLTFKDVPVEAFWSVSVYNAAGFFEPNPKHLYSVNSITGVPNPDGSITVLFTAAAGDSAGPNCIVTPQGWNYLIPMANGTLAATLMN